MKQTPEKTGLERLKELEAEREALLKQYKTDLDLKIQLLPERIRELRKKRGLTQEQVADACNMSRLAMINIESGKQGISIARFVRICAVLATTPNELLGY